MQIFKRLFERGKNLVLTPKEEWTAINSETISSDHLIKDHLLLLAAIPAFAQFLGYWLIGQSIPFGGGFVRLTFLESLVNALIYYILIVAGIWAFAQILKFVAPKFSSSAENENALKISIFSAAPYLLIGIVQIIPSLGVIPTLMSIYCLYVLYVGVPIVMKTPKEKTIPFIIVSIITAILLAIIVQAITSPILKAFGPDLYPRGF